MARALRAILASRVWLLAILATTILAPGFAVAAQRQAAVFAGGCFWCMESDMKGIPGVVSVRSGYTGGALRNPTYEDILTEKTGHYESVRVTFDPDKITYRHLLDRYWKLVDPTDDGGQFCDRGPSYRTAVFVANAAQKADAEASRAQAATRLKAGMMTTAILPLKTFWPAEDYHRNYAKRNVADYAMYRAACGRDRRLGEVWRSQE